MTAKHLLVTAAAAAAFGTAAAQTLKPGLWEITQQTQGSGDMGKAMSDMHRQIANLPPEQRKLVQDSMARQGVQMGPAVTGGGMTVKVCMTPEMVQRNQVPMQQGDCSSTAQARSGNTMKVAFACTKPPSKGEGEVTFDSPEAYRSRITVTTQAQGKPQQVTMNASGRWLAADCGSVKPVGTPNK